MKSGIFILVMGALFASSGSSVNPLFQADFTTGLSPEWRPVKFEGLTHYAIVQEKGNKVLRGESDKTASGLAVKFEEPVSATGLEASWRWKIDQIPPNGSEDKIETFDHTARIFVAFRTLIGPPRTINYVWANQARKYSTFHHPNSGRSRFIVLQSGNEQAGRWIEERRDLVEDWKRLFGDDDPPQIVGIGLMTDSDGTKTKVTGFYDDLRLQRKTTGN